MYYTVIIIVLVVIILCLVFSNIFFYRYAKEELYGLNSSNRNLIFMWDWMYRYQSGAKRINEQLKEMGFEKVDIFGAGYIGTQLCYELINSGINVHRIVDNNKTSMGLYDIPIERDLNDDNRADTVIISVIGNTGGIKNELINYYANVLLIDDLI